MQRWLVISNCQTAGLANCLQSQTSEVSVSGLDTAMIKASPWRMNARLAKFDRLFLYTHARPEIPKAKIGRIPVHVGVPILTFRAYHPDLIYIFNRDKPLSGPIGHYHSAIAFACYLKGIRASDAISYFTGHFYEKCGYFDLWEPERDRVIKEFDEFGLDISPYFRDWGRKNAFMYSYNHPRIQPLYDMASALLTSQGYSAQRSDAVPHDNLANSAIFAVYPEVGEVLGVRGQYEFRSTGNYKPISLNEYVNGCYESYTSTPIQSMRPFPEFSAQVDHITTLL